MNVLHLYSGNLFGGVETLLVTLAKCRDLCPQMRPSFGLCFRGRLWDELSATGVELHDLGEVRVSRPWSVLRARRRLKELLRARRFDAAVVHMSWPHAIFGPTVRNQGVRLAHVIHSQVDRGHWLNRWATRTKPDFFIANSRHIAESVVGWLPSVPVRTCYYPILHRPIDAPAVTRAEVRREFGTDLDATVILQASRLEAWKGQRVHLAALGRLRAVPDWEAWFAGGPQRAGESDFLTELKAMATRLGVGDRVKFLGQRSDVPRLLAAADVFCQPNTGPEPFGVVFVEALYAGLPVVTSCIGGGAEIVDPDCGILTPAGDDTGVATALRDLIHDPARRARFGKHGPTRAAYLCDPPRQLGRLADLLAGSRSC